MFFATHYPLPSPSVRSSGRDAHKDRCMYHGPVERMPWVGAEHAPPVLKMSGSLVLQSNIRSPYDYVRLANILPPRPPRLSEAMAGRQHIAIHLISTAA